MLVTPAYAQATGAGGGAEMLMSVFPFILIFIIMYFLIIRPQRTQMKQRDQMLAKPTRPFLVFALDGTARAIHESALQRLHGLALVVVGIVVPEFGSPAGALVVHLPSLAFSSTENT